MKQQKKILAMAAALLIWGVTASWAQSCLSGDCVNGRGVIQYPDGTIYAGEFKSGRADGKGVCYYSNGEIYQGEMRNHTFHGTGTYYYPGGRKISGRWANGKHIPDENLVTIDGNTLEGAQYIPSTQPKASVEANPVDIHAVIIGAAVYQNYRSLSFTDDDAYRIYSFFKSPEGGAIPDSRLTLLVDEMANYDQINTAIARTLEQADDNDMVVIYLSGHGIKGAFLPTDFDENGLEDRRIYYDRLVETLADSRAKHKLLVADVCHAGSLEESYLASRGSVEDDITNYYSKLDGSNGGTALILSSSTDEVSVEHRKIRQGVFSYYWLQGIKGSADRDGDSFVSITELFEYTRDNVRAYTHYAQNPRMIGNIDADTPVGKVRSDF